MRHVVLVADMKIANSGDVLVTHALSSCLGVLIYDPVEKIGGLLHVMLPLSKVNPSKVNKDVHHPDVLMTLVDLKELTKRPIAGVTQINTKMSIKIFKIM